MRYGHYVMYCNACGTVTIDLVQCMCYGHYEIECNACVMVTMRFSAMHVLWSQ